jgi:hypothetical protein
MSEIQYGRLNQLEHAFGGRDALGDAFHGGFPLAFAGVSAESFTPAALESADATVANDLLLSTLTDAQARAFGAKYAIFGPVALPPGISPALLVLSGLFAAGAGDAVAMAGIGAYDQDVSVPGFTSDPQTTSNLPGTEGAGVAQIGFGAATGPGQLYLVAFSFAWSGSAVTGAPADPAAAVITHLLAKALIIQ